MRVLIIDDHVMFAESLTRMLTERAGVAEVITATSVAEASVAAAKAPVHLAVVDWQIGEESGADAIRMLRSISPSTAVVVLTGSADPHALHQATHLGCAGFVTKDQASRELFDAIDAAAPRGTRLSSPAELDSTSVGALPKLSERELTIVNGIARGLTNAEIAREIFLSPNTVRNHIQNISAKLNVSSRLEVTMTALRLQLIELPQVEES